jgi:probable F420-dependent oxidoreductase
MTRIDLGRVGAMLALDSPDLGADARRLEELGFSTLWLPGGPLEGLWQIAEVVRATRAVNVASGIIPVDRFPAADVRALWEELQATHPGRFVVGLGGAHGARPIPTLEAYLDEIEAAIPPRRRVLAALGPRMLDLARRRAAGAFPVLITPDSTREARAQLGDDTSLAVLQLVVLDDDAERARALARGPLGFLRQGPAYQAHFRRMGFSDDEVGRLDDRFVDAVTAWGDPAALAAHVDRQLAAGADHVGLSLTTATSTPFPEDQWSAIAEALQLQG